jgi:hypothetical protein
VVVVAVEGAARERRRAAAASGADGDGAEAEERGAATAPDRWSNMTLLVIRCTTRGSGAGFTHSALRVQEPESAACGVEEGWRKGAPVSLPPTSCDQLRRNPDARAAR